MSMELPQEAAVAITVSTQVAEKRSIVLQTHIGRDDPVDVLHSVLDKLGRGVDRQEAKYRLKDLQLGLEHEKKLYKQLTEDFQRIDEKHAVEWHARGKKGDPVLGANERQHKETAKTNLGRYKESIAKFENEIVECKAIIAAGE